MLGLRGGHTYIVLNEIHQRLCRLRLSNWTPVFDLCHFESSFVCAATRCDTGLSTLLCKNRQCQLQCSPLEPEDGGFASTLFPPS